MKITEIISRAQGYFQRRPITKENIQMGWDTTVIWNRDEDYIEGSQEYDHLLQYAVDFRVVKKSKGYVWEYWKIKYFDREKYTPEQHWQIIHESGKLIQMSLFDQIMF